MAVTITMTGTARSCTLTSGSATMTVSSSSGLVVGATIQGTGIPTGAKIGTLAGTTVTMVNNSGNPVNATVGGAQNLIFSSVYGSTLTVSLSGGTDYATPQNIYDAGFGVMSDNIGRREIFFPGGLTITWSNIVAGAVFDFLNWSLEFGSGGRWQFEGASILGELRGGYLVNGTQFMKTAGPTFYSNSWNNGGAGGSNMWSGTQTGTVTGRFRMHNVRFVEYAGSNASFLFGAGRMLMDVENMILDHQGDSAGANAQIGAAFGTLKNTYIVKANSGIFATNGTNFATFDGIYYVGNYQSTPQHKFSMPDGFTLDGYQPQVNSSQFLGGFNNATLEIYSNINLSTAGWGLNDLKTKYQRYGGPITLQFPRTVALEFNDSTAANLTGVTLYIKSGSTSLVNAVQAGDYNANTQALNLTWTANVSSYRTCNSFVDTIAQVAQVRKYGYIEQSTSYSLNLAAYSQPFFILSDTYLSDISESTAAAISTAGINWTTKTITPTGSLSYDQINARMAWELAQTTGSTNADPRTFSGKQLTLATGWTLVVNSGITISQGTAITYLYCPTITINSGGLITALYETTAGESSIIEITASAGSSIISFNNSTGVTKLFGSNITGGTTRVYFAPGENAAQKVVRELYGYQREEETITPNGGLFTFAPVDIPDAGITEATKATVEAYTQIEIPTKFYDRTAVFRLTEQGIKLGQIVTREGTALNDGDFSHEIDEALPTVYRVTGSLIETKAASYEADTRYTKEISTGLITAAASEIISISIEDSAGNSRAVVSGTTNSLVDVWKITNSTPVADFATGTKIASDIGNGAFRFIGLDGFQLVFNNKDNGIYRYCSMSKGDYTLGWYLYDSPTGGLTQEQSDVLNSINVKNTAIFDDVNQITAGFVESTDSLHAISDAVEAIPTAILGATVETGINVAQSLRLSNAILGGKTSGGATGTETFRDIGDTKDRIVATVDSSGNRTVITKDLS